MFWNFGVHTKWIPKPESQKIVKIKQNSVKLNLDKIFKINVRFLYTSIHNFEGIKAVKTISSELSQKNSSYKSN